MDKNFKKKRQVVFEKYNGHCAYCGCEITFENFHVDHIKPLLRGYRKNEVDKGTSKIDNLAPSCASCNSSKSDFTVERWRNELELKKERIKRDVPTFNLLLRFGCIVEIDKPIIFYFEKFNK